MLVMKNEKSELEELKLKLKEMNDVKVEKEGGRKEEVLNILREGKKSIKELSGMIGIKEKNVSSVLCYLRKEGNIIVRDSLGRLSYKGNMEVVKRRIKELEEGIV